MAGDSFATVARIEDVEPGTVTTVWVGEIAVALARVGDDVYAVQHACRHMEGPLGHGRLEGCVLSCPWHGWQYDVRTGENEFDRAIRLDTYEVRVEDGDIRVAL
jgi:nitrite reductase/ring-hydroxylating ferredoxin subunit